MERLPRNQQATRNKKILKEVNKKKPKNKKSKLSFAQLVNGKSDEEMLVVAEQFLLEKKDIDEVAQAIQKSILEKPEENGAKYLIVAETMQGPAAVEMFRKGIQVLENDKVRAEENKEGDVEIDCKIASALASIAELYMTPPLWDEQNAEDTCEDMLFKALERDANNVDALQGLANLRIMRARDSEAIELLEKVVKVIKSKDNEEDFATLPPYDFRLQTSRLLIELQNYKSAVRPLDTLIKEDDTKAEVWYLLAFCHYNLRKYQNAAEWASNALTCNDIDDEIKDATTELVEKIKDEGGIVEDTTVSDQLEDQQEHPDDIADEDYETLSEEDVSDEESNMKVD